MGLLATGCELTEVTLAEPEDILVVEGYVRIGDGPDQVTVFLHWTLGTGDPQALGAAEVTMIPEAGDSIRLTRTDHDACVPLSGPDEVEGVCFGPDEVVEGVLSSGNRVDLSVRLPDERLVKGTTLIPQDIRIIRPVSTQACAMPAGRQLTVTWNRSPGAWAYSAETEISGLRAALEPQGIVVEEDSISLLGLAVSEADTSIVFPGELGVFDRFDLQQEVALALQEGFPQGAQAVVGIGALDRNYVNWVRGGNFNPSGAVRISSLIGDGVGVFGSVVRRSIRILGVEDSGVVPSCFDGD
jgi:hypothetical protein